MYGETNNTGWRNPLALCNTSGRLGFPQLDRRSFFVARCSFLVSDKNAGQRRWCRRSCGGTRRGGRGDGGYKLGRPVGRARGVGCRDEGPAQDQVGRRAGVRAYAGEVCKRERPSSCTQRCFPSPGPLSPVACFVCALVMVGLRPHRHDSRRYSNAPISNICTAYMMNRYEIVRSFSP